MLSVKEREFISFALVVRGPPKVSIHAPKFVVTPNPLAT
jgi:hypothetical protein